MAYRSKFKARITGLVCLFSFTSRRLFAVGPGAVRALVFGIWSLLLVVIPVAGQQHDFAVSIKVNQLGFYPEAEKIAVVPGEVSGEFGLQDAGTGEVVFNGNLIPSQEWLHSRERVALADFSEFTTPGAYRVTHASAGSSPKFEIRENVYRELAKASIKALYYNRASMALEEEHAGNWARQAGHPDDVVLIHHSAASDERPEGTIISSPKGWYDAGDYNKYIVNSGISTFTLMAAWEHYPDFYSTLALNLPETSNGLPDILNEARWNLEWMLSMQDPYDGGVYHKLTTLNFADTVMPHEATAPRYVVMKSTAAALNLAAVMAVAARVYVPYDSGFAEECLQAAERAWQWAVEHPDVYYQQPEDVQTGAYGDRELEDEFDWAAAELYITTGEEMYWTARNFDSGDGEAGIPFWRYVRPLAWVSLAHHRHQLTGIANESLIERRVIRQAEILRKEYEASAYRISMGHNEQDFVWGSNGVAANHSFMLLQAYRLTEKEVYLNAAQANVDYILGRNATGYSFVTGFGEHPPMFPHHRVSAADGISDPVPGFVVGGPQPGWQDGCEYPSDLPALSYLDHWCSYSTNEVAINWNAPLIYITGAVEFFRSSD